MVLYYRSIYVLYPRVLIRATEEVIKHDPIKFTARKQGAISDQ